MKIVFLDPLAVSESVMTEIQTSFAKEGHEVRFFTSHTNDTDELINRTADAEVAIIGNTKLSKKYINSCKNLKFLQVAFSGFDHVDIESCKSKGIGLSNAAGYATSAVSEMTLLLSLSLLRNSHNMEDNLRKLEGRKGYIGNELSGKTVGIIGTGHIGLAAARLFLAFGCRVLAYSRTKKNIESIEYVDLDTLLKKSDIVSLHIPYSEETNHLLDRKKLALLKPEAVLINTARGLVVDNQALTDALIEGKIAGAAVDIYEQEPPLPIDHPLLKAPNTVLVPHIAYATHQAMKNRLETVLRSVNSWIRGEQINKVV